MNSKELDTFGYIHSRKLTLSTDQTILIKHAPLKQIPESLCVYYDVLVDDQFLDNNNNDDDVSYGHFYDVITASSSTSIRPRHTSFISQTIEQQRRFVKNDLRRDNLISEFILTEENYVASLRAFVTTIVHPIRTRARDKRKRILGPYECGKVFMNIEQILQVNEAFRLDLARYQSTVITATTAPPSEPVDFGEMCLSHLREFVSYYHNFLMGVEDAQEFNTKEQKDNPTYDTYLDGVKGAMGNQTVYDYLALPGQRVGRYTMFLKELIKHTTDDHPNLPGLTEALRIAEEIANMSEDYHTRLIMIFRKMFHSIQHCPASLLSQQRSLICHLDASELDPQTLRPVRPVTLFLFTDKIMVVRRASYDSDGLELCGLGHKKDKTGLLSFSARKAEPSKRYDRKLKFCGLISLNDIEIHDGAAELPTSFTLVTSVTDTTSDTDPQTRDALEGYFLEYSIRLFQLSGECTSKSTESLMQEKENFVEQFGKAKSGHKRIDEHFLEFTHGQWKGRYFFANIYRLSTYQLLPNKSEIAIAYLEGSLSSLKSQLSNCFIIPHMLGFIIPNKNDNTFRFSILSKLQLGCISDDKECILDLTTETESTFQQFRDRFLGNLYACDKDLREVGRMATSLSLQHRHQRRQRMRYIDSTKSMRMPFQKELSRKPSRPFKFFNNLGYSNSNNNSNNSSLLSPSSSPSTSTSPIPSSATTIITTTTMTERRRSLSSDEFFRGANEHLESRISNHTASSNGSISETENDSATIVSSSIPITTTTTDRHTSYHNNTTKGKNRTRAATTTTDNGGQRSIINSVRRKSLTETIASVYRPSIHPSQTVSYEISPKRGSSSTDMLKQKNVDGLEERIKQFSSTLRKSKNNKHRHSSPIRPYPNNLVEKNNIISSSASSSSLATRSPHLKNKSNRHSMSVSPDQYNGSCSEFTTLRNSSRETLSSINGVNTNNGKQQQQQPTTISPSVSHDLITGKQTQVDEKISELLAHIKSQSPSSTASTDSSSIRTPSPAANTTDLQHSEELEQKLITEMDTIKSEFSRRYNSMINDYEEMRAVVRQLNKALKKKDDELSILRIRYQDAMAENDLLYEAFNNELDHMYYLYEQQSTVRNRKDHSSSSLDDYNDEEEEQQREQEENIIYHTHQRRPAHPSPEAQIRKKLELTLKERNQWHKTACKLARELQSLSQQGMGSRSITPTSSSSTSSLPATNGNVNNDSIRPGNSRSTPIPPVRHSTN